VKLIRAYAKVDEMKGAIAEGDQVTAQHLFKAAKLDSLATLTWCN